ncbi:hypothetical protein Scep_024054 [Stephania cephalantha]|uniref:Uncharacterized protein n=1 Tax=Stephania cephalantha TaxID=152367 RepID=A0AAP0EWH1_9MAGN
MKSCTIIDSYIVSFYCPNRNFVADLVVHIVLVADSIIMMEQEIMEAVKDNSTIIICGEIGEPLSKEVQLIREENKNFNIKAETMTVEEVKRQRLKATTYGKNVIPIELSRIVGRSFTFKLKPINYNLANGNKNFTISTICDEENGDDFCDNEIESPRLWEWVLIPDDAVNFLYIISLGWIDLKLVGHLLWMPCRWILCEISMNMFINGVVMDKITFIGGDRGKIWVKWWESISEKTLNIQHHYYLFEIKWCTTDATHRCGPPDYLHLTNK